MKQRGLHSSRIAARFLWPMFALIIAISGGMQASAAPSATVGERSAKNHAVPHGYSFAGTCQPGESGTGSVNLSVAMLSPGQYTAEATFRGITVVSFSSPFTISSANATATVTWTGIQPGTYNVDLALTLAGSTPPALPLPTPLGSYYGVTVPDCQGSGPATQITAPVAGMVATPDGGGYWVFGSDGHVYPEGDASSAIQLYPLALHAPIVGMASTSNGKGAWLVGADGGMFALGAGAPFFGSMGGKHLSKPIVGMAPTADGQGYWLVASDGGIFSFGDASFHGSTGSLLLNQPIVGMAPDYATGGYWLVAADGGIFSFDAPFLGSTGSIHLNSAIVGMEAAPDGSGYRLDAGDGGIFCFGLPFAGSMGGTPLNQPVVGMTAFGDGGYWLVARDGGIFSFGGAPFYGSPA